MADIAAPNSGEFYDGKIWFRRKGTSLTLGVTDYVIDQIGQVESVTFPEEGGEFDKGEPIVSLEGARGYYEVTLPVAVTVLEINDDAQNEPEMISDDPLEEGWLVQLEIQDAAEFQKNFDSGFEEESGDDEDTDDFADEDEEE